MTSLHSADKPLQISRGDYTTDKAWFPVTMAVCALVSARVRDQAIFNPSWDVHELSETPSETFYDAAVHYSAGWEDTRQTHTLNTLRCFALLALTAIQYGNIREMQLFLGKYHTLVAIDGLHDESNWPKDIGIVETEERRRLVRHMIQRETSANQSVDLVHVYLGGLFVHHLERRHTVSRTTDQCCIHHGDGR
jgi:hypothetical protein